MKEEHISEEAKQEIMYTEEDMKSFGDWCRNGLLNTEYGVEKLDEHLEQWRSNLKINKMKTALEFLIEQFAKYYAIHQLENEIEQAKQMHKEQMLEFGSKVTERWGMSPVEPHFIEDEYNKYFKINEQ